MSGRATSRRAVQAVVGMLLAATAAACERDSAPSGPDDPTLTRVRFDASFEYRVWWSEISECSGLSGDFDRIRFFEVLAPLFIEGQQFPCGVGFVCNGMWESPHDISLAPAYLNSERLVKHEMLHDLLGTVDHPPVFEVCEVEWSGGDPRDRGRTFP